MSERQVVKAIDPDPEDAASWCDECGAEPNEPCEPGCPCLPCMVGSVDHYVWPREISSETSPEGKSCE